MKVPAHSFDFSSPHFHPNEVKHRVVSIGPMAMTLADGYKKHLALHHRQINQHEIFSNFESFYKKLKGNKTDKGIHKTVQYLAEKAVLVPAVLFDEKHKHSYISPVFDIMPNETLFYHHINKDLVQVFAVPNTLVALLTLHMGAISWTHSAGSMIPAYVQQVGNHKENALILYIQEGIVAFTGFVEGNLNTQFMFPFQDQNDLVFNTLRLLQSDLYKDANLYVHGEWENMNDFKNTLTEKSVKTQTFALPATKWNNDILKSSFLPLQYHLSSCV